MKRGSTTYQDGNRDYQPARVENPFRPGTYEGVVVNARESNARTLRLGKAQTEAHDRIWALHYKAGYYRQGAIDPSNEPVDCQQVSDPIPLRVIRAGQQLRALRDFIGDDYALIEMTCLYGLGFRETARVAFGRDPSRRELDEVTMRTKIAYNKAAVHFGLAGTPNFHANLQAYMEGDKTDSTRS